MQIWDRIEVNKKPRQNNTTINLKDRQKVTELICHTKY